eukprot:389720_1
MTAAYSVTNSLFAIVLLFVFFRKVLCLSDETVLKAAIRLVICAALGLLSTNVVSILSFIRTVHDGEILWTTHTMCTALVTVVNLISLYLQFPHGMAAYNKCCGRVSSVWEKKVIAKHVIIMMKTVTTSNSGVGAVDFSVSPSSGPSTVETLPTTIAQSVQDDATVDGGSIESVDKKVPTVDSVDNGEIQFVLH